MNNQSVLHFLLLLLFFTYSSVFSQGRPGIFIDCQMRCETAYIKQEITFVNYMLNRQEADIYILATNQRTGAGGRQVQFVFIGEHAFAGQRDTLTYFVDPNATDAMRREQMVRELKKGLLPFILQTSLLNGLLYEISTDETTAREENQPVKDPWDYWVFNIGGNGWFNGEQSYKSADMTGRLNASRVTDQHKFQFFSRYNYEKSTFTLTDGEAFSSLIRRYSAEIEYVKSLGPKWSLGFQTEASSSTFGNTDLRATFKPAIEYNLYPYEEAQTRRFSFIYSIGPEYYNYTDTTVYDKLSEWVIRHGLGIEFNQTAQWGNISLDMGIQQFLHNPRLFNAYLNPDIEWQIFKGLSLDLGGYVSFVSDRINIAKSDITDEDILLQIKQLDTNFTYFSYVGINYRFGSKFNNFVNPRF